MNLQEKKIYIKVYTAYISNKGFYHDDAQREAEKAVIKFSESNDKL